LKSSKNWFQTEARHLVPSVLLDKYLAASLLQKAIRRDETDQAWLAASYLLKNYPAYI
jgi:hypothetical protein